MSSDLTLVIFLAYMGPATVLVHVVKQLTVVCLNHLRSKFKSIYR